MYYHKGIFLYKKYRFDKFICITTREYFYIKNIPQGRFDKFIYITTREYSYIKNIPQGRFDKFIYITTREYSYIKIYILILLYKKYRLIKNIGFINLYNNYSFDKFLYIF